MQRNPELEVPKAASLPLLVPINALDAAGIDAEVKTLLAEGFRTFKVKVGKDVAADLERVAAIQRAVGGAATLRLDANRAFDRAQGIAFAEKLDPAGIELFEQPCDSDDWDANAAVAAVSTVPLMLDEPICTLDDIVRAADIPNVRYLKLKLKRFGCAPGSTRCAPTACCRCSATGSAARSRAGWRPASPPAPSTMPASSTASSSRMTACSPIRCRSCAARSSCRPATGRSSTATRSTVSRRSKRRSITDRRQTDGA
jgi:hypothetical protein